LAGGGAAPPAGGGGDGISLLGVRYNTSPVDDLPPEHPLRRQFNDLNAQIAALNAQIAAVAAKYPPNLGEEIREDELWLAREEVALSQYPTPQPNENERPETTKERADQEKKVRKVKYKLQELQELQGRRDNEMSPLLEQQRTLYMRSAELARQAGEILKRGRSGP
jgi:hypothetical protein